MRALSQPCSKRLGDTVEEDEAIAQIETDKVTIDVRAPEAGRIEEYRVRCLTDMTRHSALLCWYLQDAETPCCRLGCKFALVAFVQAS